MKNIITEEHLKRAESVPWSARTCLVAQGIVEVTGEMVVLCSHAQAYTNSDNTYNHNGRKLQIAFDSYHADNHGSREAVVAMLPFELEVTKYESDAKPQF